MRDDLDLIDATAPAPAPDEGATSAETGLRGTPAAPMPATGLQAPRARVRVRDAVRLGLAEAWRHPRLVLLVWALFVALAWIAAAPAWRWFVTLLGPSMEGDRLLDGLDVALLSELWQYDRSPTPAIALGTSALFFVVALILNPFIAGGMLGVLTADRDPSRDRRDDAEVEAGADRPAARLTVTRRFVRDGVDFYWRFVGVLLILGMIGLFAASSCVLLLQGAAQAAADRGWERVDLGLSVASALAVLGIFALTSLLIDVARIRIVRDAYAHAAAREADRAHRRSAAPRIWMPVAGAIRLLRQRPGALLGLIVLFGLFLIAAAAIYLLLANAFSPRLPFVIPFLIVWQQLFAIVRTGLRVAMLSAVNALVPAAAITRPALAPAADAPRSTPRGPTDW